MHTNTLLTKQQDKQKGKATEIKNKKIHMIKKSSKNGNKKEKALEKNRKKRKHLLSSSDSETEIKYDDNSDSSNFCEELLKCNDDGESEQLEKEKENHHTAPFCENDWLLVKFCTKKYVKHYVGIVLNINDNGSPVVKYTRKKSKVEGDTIFTFPVLDDISEVHTEDIVSKLPTPAIGRRGQIIFKMSFHSFNIQ